jgi:2-methylisocitrate lyase-like PEP mutase family enzyme
MTMSFADLHHQTQPLLLPNAWDVASALAFIEAGYPAIGTTSFGVSASSGDPDGGRTSKAGTTALARVLSDLPVYVTTDIEDGYSDDPDEVADYVAALGVAGINIEDSTAETLIDPELHAAKIAAIKRVCPDVFVNARADNYWLKQDATAPDVLSRAKIYTQAGADGIFVPGATDAKDLSRLAADITVPLNVLAHPTLTIPQLGELGVRRVSTGSLPYRIAIDAGVNAANALRAGGTPPAATSYATMQQRLADFHEKRTSRQ